jgi:hypothetical protein
MGALESIRLELMHSYGPASEIVTAREVEELLRRRLDGLSGDHTVTIAEMAASMGVSPQDVQQMLVGVREDLRTREKTRKLRKLRDAGLALVVAVTFFAVLLGSFKMYRDYGRNRGLASSPMAEEVRRTYRISAGNGHLVIAYSNGNLATNIPANVDWTQAENNIDLEQTLFVELQRLFTAKRENAPSINTSDALRKLEKGDTDFHDIVSYDVSLIAPSELQAVINWPTYAATDDAVREGVKAEQKRRIKAAMRELSRKARLRASPRPAPSPVAERTGP